MQPTRRTFLKGLGLSFFTPVILKEMVEASEPAKVPSRNFIDNPGFETRQYRSRTAGASAGTWSPPVGSLMPFRTGTVHKSGIGMVIVADESALPCDGHLYSVTKYPKLFSIIGYAYGGSGPYFRTPHLGCNPFVKVD